MFFRYKSLNLIIRLNKQQYILRIKPILINIIILYNEVSCSHIFYCFHNVCIYYNHFLVIFAPLSHSMSFDMFIVTTPTLILFVALTAFFIEQFGFGFWDLLLYLVRISFSFFRFGMRGFTIFVCFISSSTLI